MPSGFNKVSIYANMNNNGYLLIREHEKDDVQDEYFWKIIHELNGRIMKRSAPDLNTGTLYLSSKKWESILKEIDFKIVDKKYDTKYGSQKSYLLLAQKQNT